MLCPWKMLWINWTFFPCILSDLSWLNFDSRGIWQCELHKFHKNSHVYVVWEEIWEDVYLPACFSFFLTFSLLSYLCIPPRNKSQGDWSTSRNAAVLVVGALRLIWKRQQSSKLHARLYARPLCRAYNQHLMVYFLPIRLKRSAMENVICHQIDLIQ